MEILKKILFFLVLFGLLSGEVLRIDTGQSVAMTLLDLTVGVFALV